MAVCISDKAKDMVKSAVPLETRFTATLIADRIYPSNVIINRRGQHRNSAAAYVARVLRSIPGIEEVRHNLFFAHEEFFS